MCIAIVVECCVFLDELRRVGFLSCSPPRFLPPTNNFVFLRLFFSHETTASTTRKQFFCQQKRESSSPALLPLDSSAMLASSTSSLQPTNGIDNRMQTTKAPRLATGSAHLSRRRHRVRRPFLSFVHFVCPDICHCFLSLSFLLQCRLLAWVAGTWTHFARIIFLRRAIVLINR